MIRWAICFLSHKYEVCSLVDSCIEDLCTGLTEDNVSERLMLADLIYDLFSHYGSWLSEHEPQLDSRRQRGTEGKMYCRLRIPEEGST